MPYSDDILLLPETELASLTSALANLGYTDPVAKVITECDQVVTSYTASYALPQDWRDRLIRALAPAELYRLAGPVPDNHKDAADNALKELAAIRDGKFTTLPPAVVTPVVTATGKWGSKPKIC
jgi:ATP phosphoribosyltransferase regulatory subunit HisZ